MKRFLLPYLILGMAAGILPSPRAAAQGRIPSGMPQILFYQGMLADMSGEAVSDGEYQVTMRIYDTAEGGSPLWEEKLRVTIYQGLFDTYLGERTPLNLPFDRQYWLAAQVQGEPEMRPRTLLVAAPYAFRALRSDVARNAEGLAPGAGGAVRSLNGLQGDLVIVGTDGVKVSRSGDTIRIAGSGEGSARPEMAPPKKIVSTKEPYMTEGSIGIISLALGGKDLETSPPVAGRFQDLGKITVGNQRATQESVIHVTVLDKVDDGIGPNPADGVYIVDVDKGEPGFFELHIGMIPTANSGTNFQGTDSIRIGYTIVNPVR